MKSKRRKRKRKAQYRSKLVRKNESCPFQQIEGKGRLLENRLIASRYIYQMKSLKKQKRFSELDEKIKAIKDKYGTLKKFADIAQETERVIYRLCDREAKPSNEERFIRKLPSCVKEKVAEYCRKQGVSRPIPSARHGNRSYLTDTLRNVHEEFLDNNKLSERDISISSFYRSIPEDVRIRHHISCAPVKAVPI